MTIYLLDVNVLLALSDPMHIHHEAAHRWFAAKGQAALDHRRSATRRLASSSSRDGSEAAEDFGYMIGYMRQNESLARN